MIHPNVVAVRELIRQVVFTSDTGNLREACSCRLFDGGWALQVELGQFVMEMGLRPGRYKTGILRDDGSWTPELPGTEGGADACRVLGRFFDEIEELSQMVTPILPFGECPT